MAQAGYTPISLYHSTTASVTPLAADLVAGELALNTNDEKLYFKNSAGTVKLLASVASTTNVASISFGSTGLTPSTATTGAVTVAGTLAVANGGTGITTFGTGVATALGNNVTGSGGIVLATSPTLTTPLLGTPTSGTLTNCTGLPLTTGITGTLATTNGGTGSTSTTYCSLTTNVTGTLPVANGGTGVASATAYALLAGGTTTTGPFQSIASVGTAGQVLTSNGAGALPTFQAASGGVTTITFGSTGLTPSTATSGAVSVAGTLVVANGGTGSTTITANSVILGNGTSALSSNLVACGSSGNVLTSNGTTWTSAAAGGGALQTQIFSSPGTWTNPGSVTRVRVTVVGGGGGAAGRSPPGGRGGFGGYGKSMITIPTSPVTITIGAGGASANPTGVSGGTSSFGPFASATGGGGGGYPSTNLGSSGTSTSSGTVLIGSTNVENITNCDGLLFGGSINNLGPATTYSPSANAFAGAGGVQAAPGPYGSGQKGGNGGVVVVEFVG